VVLCHVYDFLYRWSDMAFVMKVNSRSFIWLQTQSREVLAYLWRAGVDHLFPRRCMGCRGFIPPEALEIPTRENAPWILRGALPRDAMFQDATGMNPDFLQEQFHTLFSPFFCLECRAQGLASLDPPRCPRCAGPLVAVKPSGFTCSHCATSSMDIGRIRAVGAYGQGLLNAIHLLKYNGKVALSRPLGQLLFMAFCAHFEGSPPDKIIPIPLHRSRLVKRGFNQAFLLVRDFEKKWQQRNGSSPPWQVDHRLLKRCRKTASQTGFNREARRENLKNAFQVTSPRQVKGKAILLVDDVYTTGSTCQEAARVLRRSGAASVDVLVLARA